MSLRIVTANLDFVTGEKKDADHLEHLVTELYTEGHPKPDALIVGTQETKNFRLGRVLGVIGKALAEVRVPVPYVMQGTGQAKSGTALAAYGTEVFHPRLWFGADSRSTLPRWVTRGGVNVPKGRLEIQVVHLSPPRDGREPQDRYLARVKKRTKKATKRGHGWAVLGDFNRDLFAVADYLDGVPHGLRGGIGIITSLNTVVSRDGRDNYGVEHHETDHPAWWVDVERIQH